MFVQAGGIEPPTPPWQGGILPLNHACNGIEYILVIGLLQGIYRDDVGGGIFQIQRIKFLLFVSKYAITPSC